MTDQPNSLDAILAALDDTRAGIRRAWKAGMPALAHLADAAKQTEQREQPKPELPDLVDANALNEALGPIARMFMPRLDRIAAHAALGAVLDEDDDRALAALDGLTAAQLHAIEGAGSGLAILASRLRRPMVDAEQQAAVDESGPDSDEACHDPACPCHEARRWEQADAEMGAMRQRVRDAAAAQAAACNERDEQRQRAETAERRAEARERERDEEAESTKRYTGYLNAARDAAGADNWPSLPDRIRDLRTRAEEAEAMLAEARKQVERWRHVQDRKRAAAEIAPTLGIETRDRP